ncbi:Urea transporter [Gammaproteobacteria bacterium]|nr:Urea transporter [Gammaproteobacteria bacterium]
MGNNPTALQMITTRFLRALLRGVGQIFLQRSAWCGLACLVALALQSTIMALACLLGALAATLLARTWPDGQALDDGLHGYNGALAGLGAMVVLESGVMAWCMVVLAGLLATWIGRIWRERLPLPPYTAPFVLVTWLLMALSGPLALPLAAPAPPAAAGLGFMADGVLRGIGQVIFLDLPWAGALCALGLALSSPVVAGCALLAAALGMACADLLGLPEAMAGLGIYGFNAVLAVEALRPQAGRRGWWLLLAAIPVSVALTRAFQLAGLPSLTAPFILGTWLLRCAHTWSSRYALPTSGR